jgi:hypothetical protein
VRASEEAARPDRVGEGSGPSLQREPAGHGPGVPGTGDELACDFPERYQHSMIIHIKVGPDGAPVTKREEQIITALLTTHYKAIAQTQSLQAVADIVFGVKPGMPRDVKAIRVKRMAEIAQFARDTFPDMEITFSVEPGDDV